MAQRRRRRRRQRLESKYIVRRVMLLLAPVVLIAAAVWLINREPKAEEAVTQPQQSSRDASETEPTAETEPPTKATEPEPEPTPWNLLLVNSRTPIPAGYEDSLELEYITGNFQVDRRIMESITRMFNKAKGDGIDLMICSAYRTEARQSELFEGRKAENLAAGMNEEEAVAATLQYTNRPGTSEHQTGLAIDIVTPTHQNLDAAYAETAAAKWLVENAAEFGFILRYPLGKESETQVDFEPWHYRYVGEEHAKIIMEEGYSLEKYLELAWNRPAGERVESREDTGGEDPLDEPTDDPEE